MNNSDIKVLLVDDEPDILEIVGYNLRNEGYIVYTANNGLDAVKTAKKTSPHLILLDIMMPEMDGIEACERIREIKSLEDTIIAFLTARGEDYSQMAGFDAGAAAGAVFAELPGAAFGAEPEAGEDVPSAAAFLSAGV